ncbi:unnamed protein product [Effrenium voratum]|nr:unnamed protein product [Effrenium voratum]
MQLATQEEKPKEPEPPKELEEDAAPLKGAKAKGVALNFDEATLNVMPTVNGRLLRTLSEGGMSYLVASVRANTGLKSGRYMFEVRVVEVLAADANVRSPGPRMMVKVGFSTEGSSIFLGDGADNVCFDSDGFFTQNKSRTKVGQKFSRDQSVAVLLNLDEASPNKNTVSLFVNGQRASKPQPLAEHLCGKALYPTVSYRNVSLEVNLGPAPRAALPFSCHMVAAATQGDVVQTASKKLAKQECIFPVGLPEQGYFDWVDQFLQKNPGYVELSDRKIIEWASKSGLTNKARKTSGDKPELGFGVPALDDGSVQRVLAAVAPALARSFVVPELKANLVPAERKAFLTKFVPQDFARKAVVLMGEPTKEYKDKIQALMLEQKTVKAEAERKRKVQEDERKRLMELKKKKAMEARMAKEKDSKEAEEAKPEEAEDVKMEEEPLVVELTEEEKAMAHRKMEVPDLTDRDLAKSYASFALPSSEEGFDEVSFAWSKDCEKILKDWVLSKKLTSRAEDLAPGVAFKEAWQKWQKTQQEWRRAQSEWKDPAKRKAAAARKAAAEKKKLEEEKKKLMEAGDEDAAKALEEEAKAKKEPVEVDFEDLDVMAVTDIADLGNGQPLFANFAYEDWTLLSTRYELHVLLHSFKKDLDDPDRPSFSEKHLGFYYQKYFKKSWNFSLFGLEKFEDFLDIIRDTLSVENGFLKAEKPEDTPLEDFVKFTEEHRRERERRVDAGDETAKLKFTRPAVPRQDGKGPAKGAGKGSAGATTPRTSYGSSSYGNSGGGYGGGSSYQGGSYSSQKRSYTPSSYPPAKQPRTSYGSYGGGNGGAKGGSSYYNRK